MNKWPESPRLNRLPVPQRAGDNDHQRQRAQNACVSACQDRLFLAGIAMRRQIACNRCKLTTQDAEIAFPIIGCRAVAVQSKSKFVS